MRSKTSCFNYSVFKKNLTRFAPIWGLYTLCLVLGIALIYQAGGTEKRFHNVENLSTLPQIMTMVNLVYAPVVAQLLFGDLYNSRMCNAIHAMPVRREGLLVTNLLSGLLFSLVPTLVMTLVALPMTADSYFAEGWKIPFYVFAASNLFFLCYFGMAVFASFCAGNRLGMVITYALLNFGFLLIYFLVSAIYTPMLYGVVSNRSLVMALTPAYYFTNNPLIEPDRFYQMTQLFGENRANWAPTYQLTGAWKNLLIWAVVGLGFALLSLPLYRKRDLECAGDTLAFRMLKPVFHILGALIGACVLLIFINYYLGGSSVNLYIFLFIGLAIGWFAGRMLIEGTIRVFAPRNWLKCAALAALLALSLVLTHFDVLGIETWAPKPEELQSIRVSMGGDTLELTEAGDLNRVLALQQEALGDRLETSGAYGKTIDGTYATVVDNNASLFATAPQDMEDLRFACDIRLDFVLKSGETVSRRYPLWADGEGGDTLRQLFSSWQRCIALGYDNQYHLDAILEDPAYLHVEGFEHSIKNPDRDLVAGLLTAVRADCAANTMAQDSNLHNGHFKRDTPDEDGNYYREKYLYISLDGSGSEDHWYVYVYPECTNTLAFLRENDLLRFTFHPEDIVY